MIENWRAVPGHEGDYEVSDAGRVRSLDRVKAYSRAGCRGLVSRLHKGRVLSPGTMKSGHLNVALGRLVNTRLVHHLVLEAFVGPCPDGMECLHGDGNPTNNRVNNLRWGTRAENVADAQRHGTYFTPTPMIGSNHPNACLTEDDVRSIRKMLPTSRHKDIAANFNVDRTTITAISTGKNWSHVQ